MVEYILLMTMMQMLKSIHIPLINTNISNVVYENTYSYGPDYHEQDKKMVSKRVVDFEGDDKFL